MNLRRIIITAYAVVLAALSVTGGAVYVDARAQLRRLKEIELLKRQELVEAQARLKEQETILERLKSDPEFVERTLRRRHMYGKPGETIFRFPD
ncbi:septum formation initiator family protein [Opitutus sp. ER46]|uniref:FtsB family cell division protein n=1 Tax=Opitutus sp. ER46 TaxID=2161864 RepID=UPI001304D411|nr:septum formation initiator family protein [Opitutus sp. ER46]